MISTTKPNLTVNEFADFWRYNIGVNVIPADTRNKKPLVKWSEYRNKPISEWQHNQWKKSGMFCRGMAIILGRVWHRDERKDYFFLGIDKDNEKAIVEFCSHNGKTITLWELASKTLVEQHLDDPSRAHSYYYTTRPIMGKSSDSIFLDGINSDLIPALEVKSQGNCLMYCTPSIHVNGTRYEILGTFEPATLNELQTDELELHINSICKKYDIDYLSNKNDRLLTPIGDLFQPEYRILEGHNRHEALLRVMESLIFRNRTIFSLEKIKDLSRDWNNTHCMPPLDDGEFERQWKSAVKFIEKQNRNSSYKQVNQNHNLTGTLSSEELQQEYPSDSIEELCEKIMSRCAIKTLADTEEILYYRNGLYHSGGEQVIKVELEKMAGYSIKNHQRNEIIAHIKYRTIVHREDFDSDINIINVKNGLVNLMSGEIKPHSPDYLSLVQLPVKYDPMALCPKIIRFLIDVQSREGISLIIRFLGYCIYRTACYEKAIMFIGPGKNGKSILIKLIESFVGQKNVSHASLQELTGDRFASADLYGKLVNTFADLESNKLTNTGIFKTLVSGDSIRAQRKHQQPFSFRNYSKLVFSTNKILGSDDMSYAYYRRWIILIFNRIFEGENQDPELINKLTTEEEMSGLLNLALKGLRKLIKDGFKDISIEQIRQEYEHNSSIMKEFIDEQCFINVNNPDYLVSTRRFKELFVMFCKSRGLKPLEENILGKELLQFGISKDRIMKNNQRDYYYIGIMPRGELSTKYNTVISA
jgi:P4 family phage/plasmid primase-like protien